MMIVLYSTVLIVMYSTVPIVLHSTVLIVLYVTLLIVHTGPYNAAYTLMYTTTMQGWGTV